MQPHTARKSVRRARAKIGQCREGRWEEGEGEGGMEGGREGGRAWRRRAREVQADVMLDKSWR